MPLSNHTYPVMVTGLHPGCEWEDIVPHIPLGTDGILTISYRFTRVVKIAQLWAYEAGVTGQHFEIDPSYFYHDFVQNSIRCIVNSCKHVVMIHNDRKGTLTNLYRQIYQYADDGNISRTFIRLPKKQLRLNVVETAKRISLFQGTVLDDTLAALIELSPGYMARMRKGMVSPTDATIKKICKALGLLPEDIAVYYDLQKFDEAPMFRYNLRKRYMCIRDQIIYL